MRLGSPAAALEPMRDAHPRPRQSTTVKSRSLTVEVETSVEAGRQDRTDPALLSPRSAGDDVWRQAIPARRWSRLHPYRCRPACAAAGGSSALVHTPRNGHLLALGAG